MGREITLGNPPFGVALRRSGRARRLSLRVSRLTGAVTLTMPRHAPESEAIAFARSREEWIADHLAGIVPSERPEAGALVPYLGAPVRIALGSRRRPLLDGGTLTLPADRPVAASLRAFYRIRARDLLTDASDRYAARLDRTYARITLRDTRSRWGSCSSRGGLMYSWRLVMAPFEVLDYVAAHEVAHLAEMNHSSAFWAVVADLCPDYARHRDWLRREGESLHRIVLSD